jgi:hypothetical protein
VPLASEGERAAVTLPETLRTRLAILRGRVSAARHRELPKLDETGIVDAIATIDPFRNTAANQLDQKMRTRHFWSALCRAGELCFFTHGRARAVRAVPSPRRSGD